jgi:Prp8 binding protein
VHDIATPKKTMELFASVADDGLLKIWEPRSKQEIKSIASKYPLTSVSFSLHGDRVFVGGIDNDIKCYSVADGKLEETIQGHQDTISSLEISFDGTYLMSNSFDETVKIWDVRPTVPALKRLKKTLSGHVQGNDKSLLRGNWSKDGLYVCCGSVDRCVYIWDTTTKKIVQRLGGHLGTVNQTVMGKDNWLASCSNDKNIIISQLPEIFL